MSKSPPWNHPDLPARLTEVEDDIGPGAFLKRMSDSVRAIVIDYDLEKARWLVVMVKRFFWDESKEKKCKDRVPCKPQDYVVKQIRNTDDWLVLTRGGDHLLMD